MFNQFLRHNIFASSCHPQTKARRNQSVLFPFQQHKALVLSLLLWLLLRSCGRPPLVHSKALAAYLVQVTYFTFSGDFWDCSCLLEVNHSASCSFWVTLQCLQRTSPGVVMHAVQTVLVCSSLVMEQPKAFHTCAVGYYLLLVDNLSHNLSSNSSNRPVNPPFIDKTLHHCRLLLCT